MAAADISEGLELEFPDLQGEWRRGRVIGWGARGVQLMEEGTDRRHSMDYALVRIPAQARDERYGTRVVAEPIWVWRRLASILDALLFLAARLHEARRSPKEWAWGKSREDRGQWVKAWTVALGGAPYGAKAWYLDPDWSGLPRSTKGVDLVPSELHDDQADRIRHPHDVLTYAHNLLMREVERWLRMGYVVRQGVPLQLRFREVGYLLVGALALQLAAAVEQGGRGWCKGCDRPLEGTRGNRRYCDECRARKVPVQRAQKGWYERHAEEQRKKSRERYRRTKRRRGSARRIVSPTRAHADRGKRRRSHPRAKRNS
jgi:hypothetical protein